MAGCDVTLNCTGAGPPVIAEWTLAGWLVYIISMPFELLDPYEPPPVTICAGMSRLGAHAMVAVDLSLGHINIHSNHGMHNGACLVRKKTWFWDVNWGIRNRESKVHFNGQVISRGGGRHWIVLWMSENFFVRAKYQGKDSSVCS